MKPALLTGATGLTIAAALLTLVAATVAVVTVFADREAGIDDAPPVVETQTLNAESEDVEAAAQAETLSLALTAPVKCETERGQGYGRDEEVFDEDGNFLRVERKFVAWYGVQEFSVFWSVNGGTGPYRLTIAGETRDAAGDYAGASGRGRILCANTTVETFIEPSGPVRALRGDPQVDSGWKTVRAVVTDANGATAEASAQVYIILDEPSVLTRGQTYRVEGHLITAPPNHDLECCGITDHECSESAPPEERCEREISFGLIRPGVKARLIFWESDFAESERWQILDDGTIIDGRDLRPAGADGSDTVDAAFDATVDSVGKLPERPSDQP